MRGFSDGLLADRNESNRRVTVKLSGRNSCSAANAPPQFIKKKTNNEKLKGALQRQELLGHLYDSTLWVALWQDQDNTGLRLDQLKINTFPFARPEWLLFSAAFWASAAGTGTTLNAAYKEDD